ncbi:cysteine--tRNA ligase [candidate division WWE3 bacterium]|jgi:cysteinyl-tRNA synthetase|nr:cysteine--tRNA ligase [candidate division WWE3 bacterium]MBT7350733.1 cysteine--tRNA ligase [candidate division WWE3 bacterium]
MKIYNSLTKKVEEFKPLNPDSVLMYTCGPTVYDYQTIGNFRTFVNSDFVNRVLKYNEYKVKFVMNITDVGHLTGDNLGDADTGEDKLEVAADREGKSAKEIAEFYTGYFMTDYEKLNILKPEKFTIASEYIKQMLDIIKTLETKGLTYKTSDGVYFDTSKFENYGKLAGTKVSLVEEGARVETNPEKRNPTDFALWKFSPDSKMRWQEWDSPWGRGFPGWHIECSAMSLDELGDTIDIHIGGEDHKMIHHPNEIAQSEGSTGKTFVNYWVHCAFLKVDGGRMGKSVGNAYLVDDLEAKGFSALDLRYFYTTAHYRTKLNFTWEALQSASNALKKLYSLVESYHEDSESQLATEYLNRFDESINDDVNMPQAVAVMWEMLKSEIPEGSKLKTLAKMDEVLGLDIDSHIGYEVPEDIKKQAKIRWEYRKQGIWDKADLLRRQIEEKGYEIDDGPTDYKIRRS